MKNNLVVYFLSTRTCSIVGHEVVSLLVLLQAGVLPALYDVIIVLPAMECPVDSGDCFANSS